jgi:hypothetical protein
MEASRYAHEVHGVERRPFGLVRYLAPEIQLLYKAKAPRPKDEQVFARVAPRLARDARRWLREALATAYPAHPWRAALDE